MKRYSKDLMIPAQWLHSLNARYVRIMKSRTVDDVYSWEQCLVQAVIVLKRQEAPTKTSSLYHHGINKRCMILC